jgi:hypothetical protein
MSMATMTLLARTPRTVLNRLMAPAMSTDLFTTSTEQKRFASTRQPQKIKVKNPVVDLDGDEMTRIIWDEIKKKIDLAIFGLEHLVLRFGFAESRQDGRQGDGGRCARNSQAQRRYQMRDHHTRRSACGRIQVEENVA